MNNGLTETAAYNNRFQPQSISLGSIVSLGYTYFTDDPTKNNGNVVTQTVTVGTDAMQQRYAYDLLNRLTSVSEDWKGTTMWNQTYGYDPYGNRTSGSSSSPDYVPVLVPAIDPLTNRLVVTGTNYTYDHSGNLTQELVGANLQTYSYDAEGRLAKVNNTAGVYTYDGEGRRVKKTDGASATTFVYNAMGQLVAEYTNTAPSGNGGTSYLLADHLGSTRVVTDAAGNVIARHDYLPFGGEMPSFLSGRSSIAGYKAFDSTRQRFTGKERDAESGLDYFGARYFGGAMGRFMTPDPLMLSSKHLANPQRWNAYAYDRNNALSLIDPNGLDDYTYDQSGNEIKKVKRSWLHNFFVGDSHTLQAKNGNTYKLSEALKPLKSGQEYQIIGASQTSQLLRLFLTNQGPRTTGQSLGLQEAANRAADPKQWNWKIQLNKEFGPHTLFVLGDTAQRSDYIGNVAFGYLMNAWNVRIPGLNSTESAMLGGAVYNIYDSFRTGASAFKGSAFTLYDDPRDMEAIHLGGEMCDPEEQPKD